MKKALRSLFMSIGLGTLIFVPMLILDNGLNETLISVLVWTGASILYGLSFLIWKLKNKMKIPLHIAVCFIITIAVRFLYSFFFRWSGKFRKNFFNYNTDFYCSIYCFVSLYEICWRFGIKSLINVRKGAVIK